MSAYSLNGTHGVDPHIWGHDRPSFPQESDRRTQEERCDEHSSIQEWCFVLVTESRALARSLDRLTGKERISLIVRKALILRDAPKSTACVADVQQFARLLSGFEEQLDRTAILISLEDRNRIALLYDAIEHMIRRCRE